MDGNATSMHEAIELGRPPVARGLGRSAHPLGPMFCRVASANPRGARGWASAVAAGCIVVLTVAAWLDPDPGGLGTHRQLGLPQCSLVQTMGIPCPTCGMTTAFGHTVRGQWISAFQAQPAGWVLCLGTLLTAGLAVSVVATGKVWRLNWYRITPTRLTLAVAGLLLGGWAYKIITMIGLDS